MLNIFLKPSYLLSFQVNEGNVGIYYRHGALKDRVTDPGVRILSFLAKKAIKSGRGTISHFWRCNFLFLKGALPNAVLRVLQGDPDQT